MSKLFYDPTNAIHEQLDTLPTGVREQMREDARPALPPVRAMRPDDRTRKGHPLADELDHRTFETEIDGGFAWLDEVSQNIRMLAEDSNNRIDVEKNRIVKVVRKRDPEYLQGEEQQFGTTADGKRVPLSDDVYDNEEVELVSIDSEWLPAKDKWDLIFDATPFLQKVEMMRERFNKMEVSKRNWVLNKMSEDLVYSSDWFPTKRKIVPMRADIKALLNLVRKGKITRAGVFAFCNPITEKKLANAQRIYLKAKRMPMSRGKANTLQQARKVKLSAITEMKKKSRWARVFEREEATLLAAKQELLQKDITPEDKALLMEEINQTSERIARGRRKLFALAIKGEGDYSDGMSITDKKNLWDAFFLAEIEKNGEVKLSRARFRRMLYQQLFRQIYPAQAEKAEKALEEKKISRKEMEARLKKVKGVIWKKVNEKTAKLYDRNNNRR